LIELSTENKIFIPRSSGLAQAFVFFHTPMHSSFSLSNPFAAHADQERQQELQPPPEG